MALSPARSLFPVFGGAAVGASGGGLGFGLVWGFGRWLGWVCFLLRIVCRNGGRLLVFFEV
jgi:hypothetical protein